MVAPQFEIIVKHDGAEIERHTLIPGQFTIGRASASSISIKLGAVSRTHARLVVEENGTAVVEDLGSANGTQLDGESIVGVTRWPPEGTLRIGDVTLHLVAIPATLAPDEWAPTLSPSQFIEEGTPHSPITPPSPSAVSALSSLSEGASEAEVIRKHLPLVSRSAQRIDVEKEIARGGMGAVLAARESATRRTVAMKVMLRGDDAKSAVRFIEEAQVTAQLEHPNIVPVYDLSVDGQGQPFYTMKLVSGITLKKVLDLIREGRPETIAKYPLGSLLTIFQKVCDALAFAHSRGVIHRDLKPANIMLGKYGEVLVMDWGLAKIMAKNAADHQAGPADEASIAGARGGESDVFATMAGSVMGTPHYMSPEQARGENESLDARSDVFTLGVILYEILVLERPFGGRLAGEIMAKITDGDFVPPARRVAGASTDGTEINPATPRHLPGGRVPESLDAIVRKAMRLDREQRYRNVPEFQADLSSYQNGFATSAEQRSAWKQLKLLVRRNRKVAIAIAAGVMLLAISSSAFTWRVIHERDRAEAGEAAAKRQTQVAELNKEAAQLVNLAQTDPENALIRAMQTVEKSRDLLGTVTPAVQYGLTVAVERHRHIGSLRTTIGTVKRTTVGKANGRLAAFGDRSQSELLDMDTGRSIAKVGKLGNGEPVCAAMSDDGEAIAVASDGREIAVWQNQVGGTGAIREWKAHEGALRALAFEPGSWRLVSLDATGEMKAWKAPGELGDAHWKIEIPGGRIGLAALGGTTRGAVVVPPDAFATEAYAVQFADQPVVKPLRGHTARITAVAISADGAKIATADADGLARVWSIEGQLIGGPFAAQRGVVNSVAFSPTGDMVAAAGTEQTVSVFSLKGTLMHGPFETGSEGREGLAITTDGVLVAGTNRMFDLLGLESDPCVPLDSSVEAVAVAPDGSKFTALDLNGRLSIWELATRRLLAREKAVEGRGKYLAASADGRLLACAADRSREVRFLDWSGREAAPPLLVDADEVVMSLAEFPATGWVAVGTKRRLIFHDPRGRAPDEVVPLILPSDVREVSTAFAGSAHGLLARVGIGASPDASRLMFFDNGRRETASLFAAGGEWAGHYAWRTLALNGKSPCGVLGMKSDVLLWPLAPRAAEAGVPLRVTAPQGIRGLALVSADVFAVGTEGGALRLFSMDGEAITPWLRRDVGALHAIAPLPDGSRFITGGGDGRVRFWDFGVERWMQAAARHVGGLHRTHAQDVAGLMARYARPTRARTMNASTAGETVASSDAKLVIPEGFTPITGTPLAWRMPEGWDVVPQEKTALLNRLASAMLAKQRAGEFDIIGLLLPKDVELRTALADGASPAMQLIRLNSGRTPSDVERLAREGVSVLRGAMTGGQFAQLLTGGQVQSKNDESITPIWNEKIRTLSWTFEGQMASGQRLVMRGLVLPTRECSYLLGMRAGGEHIEKTQALMEKLFSTLHVPEQVRVDDAFRTALRAISQERATKLITDAANRRKGDEFAVLRDRAYAALDAARIEEGRALGEQLIAKAEELEKTDITNSRKWRLEGTNLYHELYRRIHGKGAGASALPLAERGVAKAETALAHQETEDARTALARNRRALADALRVSGKLDEAAKEYGRALDLLEQPVAEKLSFLRAELGIEGALDWAGMEHRRGNENAANTALDRALRLQKQLMEAAPQDPGAVRALMDDGHYAVEQMMWMRGNPQAGEHMGALTTLLDAQLTREGLDANTVMTLARFTARVLSILQRKPEAAIIPPKELASRTLAWLDRLQKMRPLSKEEEGWRLQTQAILREQKRGTDLPRPAGATAQQIDLAGHFTCGLDEGQIGMDPTNTFVTLPDGQVKLDGVTWDIRGVVCVRSQRVPADRKAALKVEGIRIGQRVRKLHVLHASAWSDNEAAEVGSYVLKFSDGRSAKLPIIYGRDLRNWNAGSEKDLPTPNASQAWTGLGGPMGLRLFHRVYECPQPDAEVATLDFVSANQQAAPFVVAITVE